MRSVQQLNSAWTFHEGTTSELRASSVPGEVVSLPHTAVELPFNYFDERSYQKGYTYQRLLHADPAWRDAEISLVFDGVMADSTVYLNGLEIARHRDGYTPFEASLTGKLQPGDNLIAVSIHGSENSEIPPFGGPIDYLTYAGIYRDVWLKIVAPVSIASLKVETPDALAPKKVVRGHVVLANPQGRSLSGTLTATLRDSAGATVASVVVPVTTLQLEVAMDGLDGITLWDLATPTLYTLELFLETPSGLDQSTTRFGFRAAEFTPEGFKLNGRSLKLRGLNRHQSFPYSGYALGRAAQERDAEILKNELKLNMVRTSHYPQSSWFLDRCDELGLLVFEEIPGWQHIGDEGWKAESIENVRGMLRRDWNHPSIVIWGVRINESPDDHDFYVQTNRVAHELDPTRQTGGVRCITDSELLEDVYTMNDFILGNEELGGNRPRTALRPRTEVAGLGRSVPYLITEYAGHMHPTKIFDQEQRQAEHVRRHLEVLNAAYGDPQVSGAIGWCAFDYNTHNDFGSGDRICYHGVMDMFREPKFAASVYASQCEPDEGVILTPVTFWARGERNVGGVLPLIILTNCDEIELAYGTLPGIRLYPDRKSFPHLPHAPVIATRDDFSGDELGSWGMRWDGATVTGFIDGKAVKTHRFAGNPVATTLQVAPDRDMIGAHDPVRVMVRALDQVGNKLPFFGEPISIEVEGNARLLGPSLVPLRGGATGFWVEATGAGGITINVTEARLGTATRQITAEARG